MKQIMPTIAPISDFGGCSRKKTSLPFGEQGRRENIPQDRMPVPLNSES